eukprot:672620-Amphidinium_carterae.1
MPKSSLQDLVFHAFCESFNVVLVLIARFVPLLCCYKFEVWLVGSALGVKPARGLTHLNWRAPQFSKFFLMSCSNTVKCTYGTVCQSDKTCAKIFKTRADQKQIYTVDTVAKIIIVE